MKNKRFFSLAALLSILQINICFLYSGGFPLLLIIFLPLHILLFMLNNAAAKTWLQVFILGGLHVIMTICSHQLYGWLYFKNICDDTAGRALIYGSTPIAAGFVFVLWIISILLYFAKQKHRPSDRNSIRSERT